jgi:predicted nucleic acid-binding protein
MIVFADTSALYALLVRDDSMHEHAKRCFAHFSEHTVQLLSSSFVLVETQALLQRRVGLEAVRDFNARIAPLIEILWVDGEWYNRAMQRLFLHQKRSLSLVDCLSFEIMEARAITVAFTYDKHFEENGFPRVDFSG